MQRYLLDTNILLRAVQPECEQYEEASGAVSELLKRDDVLYVTPQVIIEFWSVATRPVAVNGLGWSPEQTAEQVDIILNQLLHLDDTSAVFDQWLRLVQEHEVRGKNVHDARLVAVMQTHGVEHLLTFNVDDFKRYQEIEPVHPREVLA